MSYYTHDLSEKYVPDFINIPLDCQKTWDLICSGNTVGCFQIESRLGRTTCKKVRPRNIDELAAVVTIIRPSALEAKLDDGKNITTHYAERKNGRERPTTIDPALEPILNETYMLLLYQEQTIRIGMELAGMSPAEADRLLRKGVAKKLPHLISEAKEVFVSGCVEQGTVDKETASKIFEWIAAGARYGFNKSLVAETTVKTPEGTKKIIDLTRDDQVLTQNGYVNVVDLYDHGEQDVYRIVLDCGKEIECTLHHKFLCDDGEVRELCEIIGSDYNISTTDTKSNNKGNIDQIRYAGKKPTYDIEIDSDDHLFIANDGIVTSNSHAVSYAYMSYQTAYAKTHFPIKFYRSYFSHARDKADTYAEIDSLMEDCHKNNILVDVPDIRKGNADFIVDEGRIIYGLGHIKSMGEKVTAKALQLKPDDIDEMNTTEVLLKYIVNLTKTAAKAMIGSGAFDFLREPRKKLLFYHEQLATLKPKEVDAMIEANDLKTVGIDDCLIWLCDQPTGKGKLIATKARLKTLSNIKSMILSPPMSLDDTIMEVANWEQSFLGRSITCSLFDTVKKHNTDIECDEFDTSLTNKVTILGRIRRMNEIVTSKGDPMAFAVIADKNSCVETVVMYSEAWQKYKNQLNTSSIFRFTGLKKARGEEYSFIVSKIEEAF